MMRRRQNVWEVEEREREREADSSEDPCGGQLLVRYTVHSRAPYHLILEILAGKCTETWYGVICSWPWVIPGMMKWPGVVYIQYRGRYMLCTVVSSCHSVCRKRRWLSESCRIVEYYSSKSWCTLMDISWVSPSISETSRRVSVYFHGPWWWSSSWISLAAEGSNISLSSSSSRAFTPFCLHIQWKHKCKPGSRVQCHYVDHLGARYLCGSWRIRAQESLKMQSQLEHPGAWISNHLPVPQYEEITRVYLTRVRWASSQDTRPVLPVWQDVYTVPYSASASNSWLFLAGWLNVFF